MPGPHRADVRHSRAPVCHLDRVRVIGKDRIVPAESDPIDLGVFCVEPGRWVATSDKFNAIGGGIASPKVRAGAMSAKNQQKVWDEVRSSQSEMVAVMGDSPAAAASRADPAGYSCSRRRVRIGLSVLLGGPRGPSASPPPG